MFAVALSDTVAVLKRANDTGEWRRDAVDMWWLEDVLRSSRCTRIRMDLQGIVPGALEYLRDTELGYKVMAVEVAYGDVDELLKFKAHVANIYYVKIIGTPTLSWDIVQMAKRVVAAFPKLSVFHIEEIAWYAFHWLFEVLRSAPDMYWLHVGKVARGLPLRFLDLNPTWCDRHWIIGSNSIMTEDCAMLARRGVDVLTSRHQDGCGIGKLSYFNTPYSDTAEAEGDRRASFLALAHVPATSNNPCVRFCARDGDWAIRRRAVGFL